MILHIYLLITENLNERINNVNLTIETIKTISMKQNIKIIVKII